jgi:tetrahydromethanopterin S-methyltransferase subunit B
MAIDYQECVVIDPEITLAPEGEYVGKDTVAALAAQVEALQEKVNSLNRTVFHMVSATNEQRRKLQGVENRLMPLEEMPMDDLFEPETHGDLFRDCTFNISG